MRFRVISPLCLAAALTCCGLSARAANPKVSLKIENVTAEEAVARLSAAAGVPLQIQGQVPKGAERATFDWTEVPLGTAMRQLCERFQVQPRKRWEGGYHLYPWPAAAPGPEPKRVGLSERNGVRLYATQVSVQNRQTRSFLARDVQPEESQMQLQLRCELGERDPDAMLGVENVSARDDLGNAVTFGTSGPVYPGYYEPQYPDTWQTSLSFNLLNRRARKLALVEGDLMAYQTVRPLKVEVPLPLPEKMVRRQVGDWLIVVSHYRASTPEPQEEEPGLPALVARHPMRGPSVRLRVYYPHKSPLVSARSGQRDIMPQIQGASGRLHSPIPSDGKGAGDQVLMMTDTFLYLSTPGETPQKLVWSLIEKSDPIRLMRFRMEDIPLPEAPTGAAPAGAAPAKPAPAPAARPGAYRSTEQADHPFYQPGGGGLVSALELPDLAPTHGRMQVGLQVKQGAGWGPLRWTEVERGMDGLFRLGPLKPGVYRLRRTFRPNGDAGILAAGRWRNEEVQITVQAGKETRVPPLTWVKK